MNISKSVQRTLHVLAQGGSIRIERDQNKNLIAVYCLTRDGHLLSDCNRHVFLKLRRRRFIRFEEGSPYRITRLGLSVVRAQINNR